jgi:hypothetical protein
LIENYIVCTLHFDKNYSAILDEKKKDSEMPLQAQGPEFEPRRKQATIFCIFFFAFFHSCVSFFFCFILVTATAPVPPLAAPPPPPKRYAINSFTLP